MDCYSHSIEQQKQFYNCDANSLGVVWCSYNEWTNHLHVYRWLLTNCLYGKAAELCLANSSNNRQNTSVEYINSIASSMCPLSMHELLCYSFYHVVLVKFYCDVITEAVTAYQHFDRHLL